MSAIRITESQGQNLIESFLKTKKVKFINYELTPISEISEGYMGEHLNVKVTYLRLEDQKVSSVTFFMKHTPINNTYKEEIASKSNIYAREIFLYDVLFKKFASLGFDTSFAAESYYCIPNKAIIMENMKSKGYVITERHTNFTEDHLKCALKALAKYHAAGFAYQTQKSKELNKPYKLGDEFSEFLDESFFIQYLPLAKHEGALDFWVGCTRTLNTLISLLQIDDNSKGKFKTYLSNYKLGKVFADESKYAKTVGHGDLWSNNILFKMQGDQVVTCCLVDYQILRYFYPSFDVMLVIYSNTDREFRSKYLRELYDYYFATLTEIYANYGFQLKDVMTKEEFEETLDMLKIDMLVQVACVSAITCMPKEYLNEKDKNADGFKEAFFDNADSAGKAFQTDEMFRKVLSEVLTEMYDVFEGKNK